MLNSIKTTAPFETTTPWDFPTQIYRDKVSLIPAESMCEGRSL
ncbi:MAG: hypothetical protein SCAL_001140 [Candidatus Syntrophoarchaeum caldarius]|uniref:Uncharacterized protein n=1 Tax=Candidatus Syntropharchaeum caldarium TaxID=1838285 RepID=A0A1F2P9Q6_9EURY|nr:MAG: hypothetical protein SCAL_001140 [Candidatus Syntrophoarchaeum caldarius]